jgi:hypothetical protein
MSDQRPASTCSSTRRRIGAALAAATALLLAGSSQRAAAVILPAVTVDGPSESIVGFGGVAMAEDGTGGVVYLKRAGGVTHVFVSRFIGGRWQPPIQVDTGQPFAASWPRIGAANGGQLLVVWATPFATEHEHPVLELLAAQLGPGASGFGSPVIVDPNVGEGAGLSPDLAMSPTAQADVVYRVIENSPLVKIPLLRPSDVVEQVRLAHFMGNRWSGLGAINRNPGVSMRTPSAANAPRVAIGPNGNALVVWQEPEINGIARIWARRVFGTSLNYVLPVTTTALKGAPINGDADAPAVAFSRLGEAQVAYRQSAGPGSPLPGPRIFLNTLSDGESETGAEFRGAIVADPAGPSGARIGPPDVDIDEQQETRLLYDDNGAPRVITGTDRGLSGALSLGPAFAGSETPAASVLNPQGGGVSAWVSSGAGGAPAVAVREDFPSGAAQTGLVDGGAGGPVSELSVARSGLGDGLIAFLQGALGNAAIVVDQASAPPAQLFLNAPKGWIRPGRALVSWAPATSADPPVKYSLVLDGRKLAAAAPGALQARIDARRLGDGVHKLQLLATDLLGEATLSSPSSLQVDGSPPTVRIGHGRGHALVVRIRDPDSGVVRRAINVSWGDGSQSGHATLLRHSYARPGRYSLTIHVADKVGNAQTIHEGVSA